MPIVDGKTLIGWGVVRRQPWHFAGLFETQIEAAAKAIDLGVGYVAHFGESKDEASFEWRGTMPDGNDANTTAIEISLDRADLEALDAWIAAQPSSPSRAEAALTLIQQALACFSPNTTTIRGEFG